MSNLKTSTMTNPIRELIKAKISGVCAQFEESKSITHKPTSGTLREQYLTDFFKDVLPSKYLVKSGFLVNNKSNDISPQIDLIVADKYSMPNFSLNESTSLIPIESALLVAEIKSTITSGTSGTLNQIQKQREVINKLTANYILKADNKENSKTVLGNVIIAFESQVKEDKLEKWFDKEPNLLEICVVGEYCIAKLNDGIKVIRNNDKNKHEETLFFIGKLYNALNEIAENRSLYEPNWDNYLQDIIPT